MIYTINDLAFLYNNMTGVTNKTKQGGVFFGATYYFFEMLSRNSEGLPNCYLFLNQTYYFSAISFAYFDNATVFFESWLFGMMGNTLRIKNIFD